MPLSVHVVYFYCVRVCVRAGEMTHIVRGVKIAEVAISSASTTPDGHLHLLSLVNFFLLKSNQNLTLRSLLRRERSAVSLMWGTLNCKEEKGIFKKKTWDMSLPTQLNHFQVKLPAFAVEYHCALSVWIPSSGWLHCSPHDTLAASDKGRHELQQSCDGAANVALHRQVKARGRSFYKTPTKNNPPRPSDHFHLPPRETAVNDSARKRLTFVKVAELFCFVLSWSNLLFSNPLR